MFPGLVKYTGSVWKSLLLESPREGHISQHHPQGCSEYRESKKKFAERLYYGFHGRDWARKDGETGMLRSGFYLDRLCG